MLWRCPTCNRQTEEPICSRCETPMSAGEPSAATGLAKETAGSVLFLIAVICFTAAVVFSTVFSWMFPQTIELSAVKSMVTSFSEVTETQLSPYALKAVSTLYDLVQGEVSGPAARELPLGDIMLIVGLWLVVAQGYSCRVNFRKGGPILLKIITIFGDICGSVVAVCGIVCGVGLWFGRVDMVGALSADETNTIAVAMKNLLASEATMWLLLGLCGCMAVFGFVYMLFFRSLTKTLNGVLFTAKTGDFGKRAGGLAAVLLCFAAVGMCGDAVVAFLTADFGGIGSVLYGVSYLFFAITLFSYRRRAYHLAWEQPAFSGETAAAMPGIPAGLKASDLMNEAAAKVPAAPMSVSAASAPQPLTPSRTLNEPFAEESLEPQPMTGNGVCPKCGTPIPDHAFFCLNCGHKFQH